MNPQQHFETYQVSQLKRLGVNVPDWQRLTSQSHIGEIYKYLVDGYKRCKCQPVLTGVLVLCCKTNTGSAPTWFLIDGQHRYLAMLQVLEDTGLDCHVMCNVIHVSDEKEAHDWFRISNVNMPMKRPPSNTMLNIPNEVARRMQRRFPVCFKDSARPRRPHLNIQQLADNLLPFVRDGVSADAMVDQLMSFNKAMSEDEKKMPVYPHDNQSKLEEMWKREIPSKGGLYLGMYKNYEFVKLAFEPSVSKTNTTIDHANLAT